MKSITSIRVPISDGSFVGEARRQASGLALRLGFDETQAGRVSLVMTEAAGNIIKHAGTGEVLIQSLMMNGVEAGIEILALDQGPGMSDIALCLSDGYSTARTAGTGLGAIKRLSNFVDIHSAPGAGTALLARVLRSTADKLSARPPEAFEIGGVCVPIPGETVCGDAYSTRIELDRAVFMVVDGLGHGPLAAAAAAQATEVFADQGELPVSDLMGACHRALKSTRGASIAICEADLGHATINYVGIGNISGALSAPFTTGTSRHLISQNGTAGHSAHRIRVFQYPLDRSMVLIMHSDGLASHWKLEAYAGLANHDPTLIAGVLYRDFKRGRDDATVLIAKGQA